MKKDYPLVSIIVINYNGEAVLPSCIKSIQQLKYSNWEVILVDNGSTDKSISQSRRVILDKNKKKFIFIKNDTNLGFAPANNLGYEKSRGEYILLLNNDTRVKPDLLNKMILRMKGDKIIGAMQPKIYLMDKPTFLDNAGSFLNSIGFSNHWGFGQKDSPEFDNERIIFAAKGARLLTRKDIIDKVGLFDPDFGSYFEESDFCWRVWMSGWKVLYYPKTSILHKVGFTSSRQSAIDINYHSLKNRIASFIKNFELFNLIRFLSVHIIILLGLAGIYLLKFQFNKVKMITNAIWWNIIHLGQTWAKRKLAQSIRVESDKNVLPYIMQNTNIAEMLSHFRKVEKNFK